MTRSLCARCAQPAVNVRIEKGLPVCSPACPSAEQLLLLPITDSEIDARNLRYFLVGAL